ncbi:hypothetical protein AQUCO_00500001v1 [Aquilegia coerulea]|uniref:Bulb-type lectin domain-containing protein n=1 Tax=Aquilegia coerulea TaxID=218851 RepID=A0A2G5EQ76_AQUCA|nr:hypothetical protein AQUCO_00500001v1 [Aquilegia coerulea]
MTLALRLDTRVVWEANRGKPVHKNSTVSFGQDGNLVLADAHGNVVWQTNTANKGVVDLQMLPNGNMVLVNTKGEYVWQSFDHPTDTILVSQSLLPGDKNKLVSRISAIDNRDGPYSLVIDGERIIFYYKSKRSAMPEIYSLMKPMFIEGGVLEKMTVQSYHASTDPYLHDILLNFTLLDKSSFALGTAELTYNATYSFLQLGQDGNLRIYTYYDKLYGWTGRNAWHATFTLFSADLPYLESQCQLPEKCGNFGLCEDNQCVACPTPKGLMGWSKKCSPPKLPRNCNGAENVEYYKIAGVDHFSSSYSGEGPMRLVECKEKCNEDCKCLGFFYNEDTSMCLATHQLKTLTKVSNSTHLAFIKMAKQDHPISQYLDFLAM